MVVQLRPFLEELLPFQVVQTLEEAAVRMVQIQLLWQAPLILAAPILEVLFALLYLQITLYQGLLLAYFVLPECGHSYSEELQRQW